ncbi:MAG: bifunctional non-ous end joining protein LigD, partial [Acidimicrobiaceae bacterium]
TGDVAVAIDAVLPMKAVSGELPADDEGWAYEIKWDGMRVLAVVEGDSVRLRSSNGKDATGSYPELAALADSLDGHTVLLDGEVVAFDDEGRPSFGRLQQRMHVTGPEVARRVAETPILYVVFDLLHFDGNDTMPLPYLDRRFLLSEVVEPGDHWQVPGHQIGDGASLLQATKDRGLEGVMAKRVDSVYLPGKRSPAWRKVKARRRQEMVIGGWQPGEGRREGVIGSVLVGHYEDGRLRFAGKVGTGFSDRELQRLTDLFASLATDECPFDPPPPRLIARTAHWLRPELVAEVEFAEWTGDGSLRHPAYLGLRDDKDPTTVVREP